MTKRTEPEEKQPAEESEQGRTITDARMRALADYIDECQHAMKLNEWVTRLKWDRRPNVDGADAQVLITKNRYQASLLFAEDFFSESPEDQRITVCHELCHLIFDPVDILVWDGEFQEVVGRAVFATFASSLNAAVERVIDRISTLLAPTLPLPDLDAKAS